MGQPPNPRWARRVARLLREEVAEKARRLAARWGEDAYLPISPEQLAAWESGQGEPELFHLGVLCEIYDCAVGYFLLPRPRAIRKGSLVQRGASDHVGRVAAIHGQRADVDWPGRGIRTERRDLLFRLTKVTLQLLAYDMETQVICPPTNGRASPGSRSLAQTTSYFQN